MKKSKFKQRSFNLVDEHYVGLKGIAKSIGCYWRNRPSVGKMLREIATGKLKVTQNDQRDNNAQG